jgi:hypothetical protein
MIRTAQASLLRCGSLAFIRSDNRLLRSHSGTVAQARVVTLEPLTYPPCTMLGAIAEGTRRRTIAGPVLAITLLACLWIGTYTHTKMMSPTDPIPLGPWYHGQHLDVGTIPYTPSWALPLAIVVGVAGGMLAALTYRPRRLSG